MTFVLGWSTENHAYLVADAAQTMRDAPTSEARGATTIFGEKQYLKSPAKHGFVQERALKLVRLPRAAIAFSGSVAVGERLIRALFESIQDGASPLEALRAVTANAADLFADIKCILAYHSGKFPGVASWNHNNSRRIEHHTKPCMIGNVGSEDSDPFAARASHRLTQLALESGLTGDAMLACGIGALQRLGLHYDMMSRGIGGTYGGLWVDLSNAYWQPNCMYIYKHPIGGCFRVVRIIAGEDCLFADDAERNIVLCAPKLGEAMNDVSAAKERGRRLLDQIVPAIANAHEWDFITVFSEDPHPEVIVQEMRKSHVCPGSPPYWVQIERDESGEFGIRLTERMTAAVRSVGRVLLTYIPHSSDSNPIALRECGERT